MADLADTGQSARLADSEKIAEECEAVEAEVAALRVAYEQYFIGLERQPPAKKHADVQRQLKKLKGMFVRQTAVKFRIQSLQAKFATYERLWARTLKEMEEGTYKRDVYKAKLRSQKAPAPKKEAAQEERPAAEVDELDDFDVVAEEPAVAPAPKVASMPSVPAVEPVSKGGSMPSIPAVAPVSKVPSSPGIPAVAPVSKGGSMPSVPAVAPVSKGGSSPGIPAVAPVSKGASSTKIPAVTKTASSPGTSAVPPAPPIPSAAKAAPVGGPAAPAGLRSSSASPAVPKAPAGNKGGAETVSEAKLKAVYEAYVTAKKRCQEDVSQLSYESVAANLRKQVPELMKKHNAAGVEFKVVIKDGKAVLKAVPK